MYKYIPLLIIPLVFTFSLDYLLKSKQNNKIAKINFIKKSPLNIKIPSVHKNFDFKFDSTTINNFYSEKIIENIDDNNIVKLTPKAKVKFIKKNKILNLINVPSINPSVDFISPKWQKNFSNKKILFIKTVLPLIEFENQKIILERNKLLNIKKFLATNKTLKNKELIYLESLSKKYNILLKNKHKIDIVTELLLNVNIIPNSIVLAQAANESGWGTSRFAKEYNALFGQYTYDEKNGVIPFQREEGKKHLIKNFTSINKSVESYFKNINSHYAYQKFRYLRSQLDNLNNDFNIKLLTNTLDVYAEDELYVDTINRIIKSNNLNQFDLSVKGFLNS